jgi:hypothetical protein
VCAEPHAQDTSNVERTVCTTENTTESRSAISNTFYNDMEKRNPYQSKSPRPKPTLASVSSPVYNTSVVFNQGYAYPRGYAKTS